MPIERLWEHGDGRNRIEARWRRDKGMMVERRRKDGEKMDTS